MRGKRAAAGGGTAARPANAPQLRPCASCQLEHTVAKASPRRGAAIERGVNGIFLQSRSPLYRRSSTLGSQGATPSHTFDGRFSRRSRRRRPHSRRMDVCARHHSSALDVPTASVDIIRRARSVVVAQGSVAGASQQRGGLLASSAAERHERISCCDSCRRRLPPSPHQAEGPRRAATGRRRPAGSRGRVALSGSRVDDVDIWSMCTCCVVE